MFGYVRARRDTMAQDDWTNYEAVYCGLCHVLDEQYGWRARLLLNYDFAFLAMLLAPGDARGASGCRRCLLHPRRGKPACAGGDWLDLAAAESVILAHWKLQDTVADDGPLSRLEAGALSRGLRRAYRKARERCPTFDAQVETCLRELWELESAGCTSIDRTADCFARLLRAAAPATDNAGRDRARGELLYHLGRWIYLIDGVDDLAEDRKRGHYNPVLARFPDWSEEDSAYLRQLMDRSLDLAGAAFQLLDGNVWTGVIENILYSGLSGVEELVFSGKWREQQKKDRRIDP